MPRKPKATQTEIPGTERKRIPEIEDAAGSYKAVRDERMELTKEEVEKKANLMAAMKKHKLTTYIIESGDEEVPNEEVVIEPSEETVKVRQIKPKGGGRRSKAADEGDDEAAE